MVPHALRSLRSARPLATPCSPRRGGLCGVRAAGRPWSPPAGGVGDRGGQGAHPTTLVVLKAPPAVQGTGTPSWERVPKSSADCWKAEVSQPLTGSPGGGPKPELARQATCWLCRLRRLLTCQSQLRGVSLVPPVSMGTCRGPGGK